MYSCWLKFYILTATYGNIIRKGIKHALQFQKAKLFVAQSEPLT